jgi:hypothetical protein
MNEDKVITLTISLDQAGVLTKSVGKTLASEQAKIDRHGRGNHISRQAARDWALLDDIDAQLREQMGGVIRGFE